MTDNFNGMNFFISWKDISKLAALLNNDQAYTNVTVEETLKNLKQ